MAPPSDSRNAHPLPFDEIARLPLPGDNVAIATRTLAAGTQHRAQRPHPDIGFHCLGGAPLRRRADCRGRRAALLGVALCTGDAADRAGPIRLQRRDARRAQRARARFRPAARAELRRSRPALHSRRRRLPARPSDLSLSATAPFRGLSSNPASAASARAT